jgi:hypothetical protein
MFGSEWRRARRIEQWRRDFAIMAASMDNFRCPCGAAVTSVPGREAACGFCGTGGLQRIVIKDTDLKILLRRS